MPNATNVFLLGLSGPAEQRTFATGLQTVLGRLVAGIPSPLAYGGIIESTCLLKARIHEKTREPLLPFDLSVSLPVFYRQINVCSMTPTSWASIRPSSWRPSKRRASCSSSSPCRSLLHEGKRICNKTLYNQPKRKIHIPGPTKPGDSNEQWEIWNGPWTRS